MKRRTTITLTILGILAMAGIFYAANPTPFTTVPGPTGVAASTTQLLVSEYTTQNIDTIDCAGIVSVLATLPGIGNFGERYMTIAPSQAASATPAPFTPGTWRSQPWPRFSWRNWACGSLCLARWSAP